MEDFLRIVLSIGFVVYIIYRNIVAPARKQLKEQESKKAKAPAPPSSFPKPRPVFHQEANTRNVSEEDDVPLMDSFKTVEQLSDQGQTMYKTLEEQGMIGESHSVLKSVDYSMSGDKDEAIIKSFQDSLFQEYKTKKKTSNRYSRILRQKQTAKDAVVFNEVFKPKYID